MSVYLDRHRAGFDWLLDPESARLHEIAHAAMARTPESPCDAAALARDADLLAEVVRERHFGVATGVVATADDVVTAWRQRLAGNPRTWGAAVTELQFDLKEALGDQHVRLLGAPRWRDGRTEQEHDGRAVEERVVGGVLVLVVRRLIGGIEDERLLARWSAGADRHFGFDRIVLDLRGNPGGNDGHTYEWVRRRLRHVPVHLRETIWRVQEKPLGNWNAAAWYAAQGIDVPPHLVAGRHDPKPDDRFELVEEDGELPAGDAPWGGRMIVLVDRRTRSSGESSAWLLRDGMGAILAGDRTTGMIEYGNIVPYPLPRSGLVVNLPTKRNDYGLAVEGAGFPVDIPLPSDVTADEIATTFDRFI
jgi:hypothetical protein